MAVEVNCPECSKAFSVSQKRLGRNVNCRACNHSFKVKASQVDSSRQSNTEKNSQPVSSAERRKKKSGLPVSLGTFGLLLIALSFSALWIIQAIYFGFRGFSLDPRAFATTLATVLIATSLALLVVGGICSAIAWIGGDGRIPGVIGSFIFAVIAIVILT